MIIGGIISNKNIDEYVMNDDGKLNLIISVNCCFLDKILLVRYRVNVFI